MRFCILFIFLSIAGAFQAQNNPAKNEKEAPVAPATNTTISNNKVAPAEEKIVSDTLEGLEEIQLMERSKPEKKTSIESYGIKSKAKSAPSTLDSNASMQVRMESQFSTNQKKASTNYTRRSASSLEQAQMDEAVGFLNAIEPESFQANLYYYQAGHFDTSRFESLDKACKIQPENSIAQKELATYYILTEETEKADSIIELLGQKAVLAPGQFAMAEDLVNSVQANSTLLVHGYSDLLPTYYFNSTQNAAANVTIVSLDLMQSKSYQSSLIKKGYQLPASESIDTSYLQAFCNLNSEKEIYLALSFPKNYFTGMLSELYPVGLAFHYQKPSFDLNSWNMNLWETKWNHSLISTKSNDQSDQLVGNYIPFLVRMLEQYEALGSDAQATEIKSIIKAIGIRTNKSTQLKKYSN